MGFTFFFRDGQALDLLGEHVVPDLSTRRYIDVWDAGCSNGAEPYSVAITFREHMGPFLFRNVRIWATDIDETDTFGAKIARGVYSEQETKRIPPEIRAKYFSAVGCGDGELQLTEEIRRAVRFQRHDLLSLSPIREQFGLIVCKNVLLHFSPQQRVDVIRMFHQALARHGYFVTERTQDLPPETKHLFSRVVGSSQLFQKRAVEQTEPNTREDAPHEPSAELTFTVMDRRKQGSTYDWMNIDCGATRVGKVRGLAEGNRLTIHSLNIFPEFERHGIGRRAIETFKDHFEQITADRVRHTAVGFWKKMDFRRSDDGSYVWRKRCSTSGSRD
jgi:chemotaxis protein methyltransferase CheR